MRHRVKGRKLGRTTSHLRALLRNQLASLFDHERITTTVEKAKELRPLAEKMITLAKREDNRLHARRQVLRYIPDKKIVAKLFDTLSGRYAARVGGYTRIVRIGSRQGDGAEIAFLELIGRPKPEKKEKKKEKEKQMAKERQGA
jgi:large subunit ribosomal protein L17